MTDNLLERKRDFSIDRCFVCDELLVEQNRTEEHVYPKWLQRKFDLYNQKISLINGTLINYRNLKVPCCKRCNEKMSRKIEKPMERAVEGGYEEFLKLDRDIIFQWLNKLSYGMLYKEAMLFADRKNAKSNFIMPHEILNELHMKYVFLLGIIQDTKYTNVPYSLLIFKIKQNGKNNYWGYDSFTSPVFCMMLGEIGIIANLQDNKYNEVFFMEHKAMKELLDKELHVMQYREVCARFFYKSSLFFRNPSYIMIMDEDTPKEIISNDISGWGYEEWNQKEYAKILAFFLQDFGLSYKDLYKGNDRVWTILRNEDGDFIEVKDY